MPIDIAPKELLTLREAGRDVVLIDCREQWEWDLVHLPDALLLPLGELARRTDEVPVREGAEVIVYCHHGIRSRRGAMLLRQAGFPHARSLAGGIDEWALFFDPTLPRY